MAKHFVVFGEESFEIVSEDKSWVYCKENRFRKCNPGVKIVTKKDEKKAEEKDGDLPRPADEKADKKTDGEKDAEE